MKKKFWVKYTSKIVLNIFYYQGLKYFYIKRPKDEVFLNSNFFLFSQKKVKLFLNFVPECYYSYLNYILSFYQRYF